MFPNYSYGKFDSKQKGFKVFDSKERITLVLCTNATGSIRVSPLIIGKHLRPTCFRNGFHERIPYMQQQHAWMDSNVCKQLFDSVFVPQIQRFIDAKQHVPDLG